LHLHIFIFIAFEFCNFNIYVCYSRKTQHLQNHMINHVKRKSYGLPFENSGLPFPASFK
jgi:hypothetical protein